jgi:preprotein translocase subunit SecG
VEHRWTQKDFSPSHRHFEGLMQTFVMTIHVFVGLFLIVVVLLQSGKAGGMGAALGGGSSAGVFGARGANTFLSRLTAGCAVVFFLTSMSLAVMSSKTGSVVKGFGSLPPTPNKESALDAGGASGDINAEQKAADAPQAEPKAEPKADEAKPNTPAKDAAPPPADPAK